MVSILELTKNLDVESFVFAFDTFVDKSERFNIFPEYKKTSTRTATRCFDKDGMIYCLQKYYEDLKESGLGALVINGFEADDVIAELRSRSSKKNAFGIISSDGDFKQEVKENVFLYDPINSKVYINNNSTLLLESALVDEPILDVDMFEEFFKPEPTENNYESFKKFLINYIKVDPDLELMKKILIGDSSDNIDSCYKYKTKNGSKEFGFTKKRFENMAEKGIDFELSDLYEKKKLPSIFSLLALETGRDYDPTRDEELSLLVSRNITLMDLNVVRERNSEAIALGLGGIRNSFNLDIKNLYHSSEEKENIQEF